jgi:hypothetical protein
MSDQLNENTVQDTQEAPQELLQDKYEYPQEQEAPQEKPKKQEAPERESEKEANLRILRERAEAAERRAWELEQRMNQNQPAQQNKEDEDDDEWDLSDDSFVEGKDLKKYVKKLKKTVKDTHKSLEEFRQRSALEQAELRLKSQFPDFESVVTEENIRKLQQADPVEYRSIMNSGDIYDRGYLAYKRLRDIGVSHHAYEETDERLSSNKNKPRSASNASPQASETPLTRVGDYDRRVLTEERKAQLRRQVEEAKRNKV